MCLACLMPCFPFGLVGSSALFAQNSESIPISKLTGPVILDGHVNERAWKDIEPLPMVSHWPAYGREVGDSTVIRIGYDDENLYMSCICKIDPQLISAPTYKRDDAELNTDQISISIDSFFDRENAVWFIVTPTASRTDGMVLNDANGDDPINLNWDSYWEAETQITETGWSAEVKIPFRSLRFENIDSKVTMGLSIYRYDAHNVRMETFPAISPNWGFWSFIKPSQAQPIDFNGIQNKIPVYITPYLLGGHNRISNLDENINAYEYSGDVTMEGGAELKMGLSNNVTLDLTVNTDFAQVEADDQQVNLTRFSLFFPERRQFFLERSAVFDYSFNNNDRLFYSRRIGLNDGLPIRIIGGARMIARANGWDVGLLSMQTARETETLSENFSVARIRKQVINSQSYAGGMITSRLDEKGNYNMAYGLDGNIKILNDDFLKINLAQAVSNGMNRSLTNPKTLRFSVDWEKRKFSGLSFNFSFNYSGNDYDPGIGFQLRKDYIQFGDRISYGWQPDDHSPIQRFRLSLVGDLIYRNQDFKLETYKIGSLAEITWRRGDYAEAGFIFLEEHLLSPFQLTEEIEIPAGQYGFSEVELSYHTPRGRSLRAILNIAGGGYFDGSRISASIQPQWSLSRIFQFDLFYEVNRISLSNRNQELTAHIARIRSEITLNTKVTVSTFVQYNSNLYLSVINARFRYNPRDGNNFYIVFNENINSDRDRVIPALPLSGNRSILVKYNHTFNL